MSISKALLAGVVGAAVMSLIAFLVRLAGFPFGFEMLLGSWVTGSVGYVTWLFGLGIHLAIGAVLGVIYAVVFHWLKVSGARVGVLVGVVHFMCAGFALAMIPAFHPVVPDVVLAPGIYMSNLGPLGVALFVIAHLVYGAVVGGLYRRQTHARVVVRRRGVASYP